MSEEQKIKVIIAPEVLEQMEQEFEPEELQRLLDEIQAAVDNGTIFEDSQPVDLEKLQREDPAEYALLMAQLEKYEDADGDVGPTLQ